jgi:hypothetical protein
VEVVSPNRTTVTETCLRSSDPAPDVLGVAAVEGFLDGIVRELQVALLVLGLTSE